ncbi:hypothetical protein TCAL_15637, partial [Tigriopus californicus]
TADDSSCSKEAKLAIHEQFYVDDYLNSHNYPKEALAMAQEVCDVLSGGNFNLRGWQTNHPVVADGLGISTTGEKHALISEKCHVKWIAWLLRLRAPPPHPNPPRPTESASWALPPTWTDRTHHCGREDPDEGPGHQRSGLGRRGG